MIHCSFVSFLHRQRLAVTFSHFKVNFWPFTREAPAVAVLLGLPQIAQAIKEVRKLRVMHGRCQDSQLARYAHLLQKV